MKTKLFIGFLFDDNQIASTKIRNFRLRFDPKFKEMPHTHLGVVEPFECESINADMVESLKEEIETFYFQQKEAPMLGFKGLDFMQMKKRNILSLMPSFDQEVEFLKELLIDVCHYYEPKQKIQNSKKFITLGRFHTGNNLNKALHFAKREFNDEQMKGNSIWLFKKTNAEWEPYECLYQFEETVSPLLQPAFAKI